MEISAIVEQLLMYAEKHNLAEGLDITLARNLLLDLLQIPAPYHGEPLPAVKNITEILSPLSDYAFARGLIEENTVTRRDLFEAKIMGMLIPRNNEISKKFFALKEEAGTSAATDYFYNLSAATNYIQTERIKKNLSWLTPTDFGELQITINLSKPEKDPRDIAKALTDASATYPECLLCVENVGYAGHLNHPARQNHRIIPLTLGGEQWYFQYSPYLYYNEHCIPLNAKHVPIKIGQATFEKLFDFLEIFPHYFVGSNADLPIVGGSILSHDHFQGGRHTFPIENATVLREFSFENGVTAEIIKWPMSVLRLKSTDRNLLTKTAVHILGKWRGHADGDIIPYSGSTPHNTITPIARIKQGYELDLVLRNNRTCEEHPDGIFHPHQNVHHIKKENIGLIEVMGLAILPGRLADTLPIDAEELRRRELYIGENFLEALTHAGVYKTTQGGLAGFEKFIKLCGGKGK